MEGVPDRAATLGEARNRESVKPSGARPVPSHSATRWRVPRSQAKRAKLCKKKTIADPADVRAADGWASPGNRRDSRLWPRHVRNLQKEENGRPGARAVNERGETKWKRVLDRVLLTRCLRPQRGGCPRSCVTCATRRYKVRIGGPPEWHSGNSGEARAKEVVWGGLMPQQAREARGKTVRSSGGTEEGWKHPPRSRPAWDCTTAQRGTGGLRITWQRLKPAAITLTLNGD